MRHFVCLLFISWLGVPVLAIAQSAPSPDQSGLQQPPPPDQPGMLPPPGQPGMAPPPPGAPPPPHAGRAHHHGDAGMMRKWQQRFDAANTTHDGRLTLQQAQQAGLKPIADHFAVIDVKNRGYLTFNDIMAWHLEQEARQLEHRAAMLRAQD